jgi:carboxypeptidase family protein
MRSRFLAFKLLPGMVVAMFCILSLPVGAHAQLTRGAITGTVRDEAGASIPDALVRIINPQTNVTRETNTNNEGFYRMGAIEPGTYTVTVEKSGFTKIENRAVLVQQANETTFDIELKAGAITSTVDVTAQSEAISVNKTNPTIGLTTTARQVVELPLGAARDVNNLALLSPNVFSAPGSTGISANGQRARNNNFTIDGSDNNDLSVTISTVDVVPEAVGEFQIQTNAYNVEFGRNSGAQINVITRSGTNDYHGDAFEYYRGSRLNALDNIEKSAGQTRPSRFNRNQFGFALGGPLHLPRFGEGGRSIFDGRDRTFFFYLFQRDSQRTGATLGARFEFRHQPASQHSQPFPSDRARPLRVARLSWTGLGSLTPSTGLE